MANETKDEEMICGLTADERDELMWSLNALPETMPPRAVWNRIREQAQAEGLIRTTVTQRPSTWLAGFAVAAAVVLAMTVLPRLMSTAGLDTQYTEPPALTNENPVNVTALQALMVQSQQLESDLRALPDEPKVMRASTVATLSDIEDAIAAIDFQLNESGVQMTPDDRELFWRERVRLMKSLVRMRYAQAQRTAF